MTMPICDFTTPNQILAGGWPWRVGVAWSNSDNCWKPLNADAVDQVATSAANTNTKLDTIHADLAAGNSNTDGIEGKLDALLATQIPANVQYASATVIIAGTATAFSGAGNVVAVSCTANISVADNATLKSYFSAGFWVLPRPIAIVTSCKWTGLLAASATIWYTS